MKNFIPTLAVAATLAFAPVAASLGSYLEVPKLTLSAQATLHVPADELQMRVGVVTIADTAHEALEENNVRMQAVIASLQDAGLTHGDYETGHFSISPRYSPYPKDPPADWRPKIVGYEVSNSVQIHTLHLDIAGKLIDAANKAGANTIDNISFALKDYRDQWNEAVETATRYALEDAQTIAKAANVRLVQPLNISLDNGASVVPRTANLYLAKGAGDTLPPIEAGTVALTAHVTVTYEIAMEQPKPAN